MHIATRAVQVALFALFVQTAAPDGWFGLLKFAGTGVAAGLIEYMGHAAMQQLVGDRGVVRGIPELDAVLMTIVAVLFPVLPADIAVFATLWYGVYEVFHNMLHDGVPHGYVIERARKHHDTHHANSFTNYGVMTHGWDAIFGTEANTVFGTEANGEGFRSVMSIVPVLAFI